MMEIISSSGLNKHYEENGFSKETVILRYYNEDGIETDSSSFAKLDKEALSIAYHLRVTLGLISGTPVALLFPPGLDMLRCILGCIYAGVRAVPLAPPHPSQWDQRIAAVRSLLANSQAALGLTSSELLPLLRWTNWKGEKEPVNIHWESLSISSLPPVGSLSFPEISANSVCVLQFSSGSTGNPKGVMLSHQNIICNIQKIIRSFAFTRKSLGVSWLPMYHDMGLIGNFFTALIHGGPNILMSPLGFLRRPLRWLELISEHRADISGAPNFAYELIVKSLLAEPHPPKLDLSHWRVAYCGAEPVRVSTMRKMIKHFSPFGFKAENFSPVYGMAETTLLITCKDPTSSSAPNILSVDKKVLAKEKRVQQVPQGLEMISLGSAEKDTEVAIVNPDSLERCTDGLVGYNDTFDTRWERFGSKAQE